MHGKYKNRIFKVTEIITQYKYFYIKTYPQESICRILNLCQRNAVHHKGLGRRRWCITYRTFTIITLRCAAAQLSRKQPRVRSSSSSLTTEMLSHHQRRRRKCIRLYIARRITCDGGCDDARTINECEP